MSADALYYISMLLASSPAIAIAAIFVHYFVKRAAWKRAKRSGREKLGFFPTSVGLGMMFLFMQAFTRPSLSYVLEAKQQEEADEDDSGDSLASTARLKHFHRQLRKIRRREPIDKLVWRL